MKRFLIILTSVFTLLAAHGEEITPDHRASIVKLLEVAQVREQSVAAMNAAFDAQMENTLKTLSPEQQVKLKRAIVRIKALLEETLSWETLEPKLVEIYGTKFSKEEVDAIIPHLESAEMQSFLKKQIEIIPANTAIGTTATAKIQGRIQEIVVEELNRPD